MSLWSLVYPKETYNLVLNPSAEIAGNFTAVNAATVTRDASHSYRGLYSYKVVTTNGSPDGIQVTIKAAANAIHYVSFRLTGGAPASGSFSCSMDAGAHSATPSLLITDGTVTHYGVQIPAAYANGSTALLIFTNGAVSTFYIDCIQVEQDTTWTTYFDGDEPNCWWGGTKHGSYSCRPEWDRNGGYVKSFDTYSVYVESCTGLSSPSKDSLMEPRALVDGNVYQGTRAAMRTIGLTVHISGTSLANFYSLKKAFFAAISRHLVSPQQPVTFWYSGAGKIVTVRAFVESGDEGGVMEGFYEKVTLNLVAADDTYWEELLEQTAAVNNITTLAVEQMVAYRPSQPWNATTGYWDALGAPELSDGSGAGIQKVYCHAKDGAGNLFVGGDFQNLNGIANADYAAYRTSAGVWTALAAGLNGAVRAIVPSPDGVTYYIIGEFSSVGGDANKTGCMKWTLAGGFAALSGGLGGPPFYGLIGPDGKLYVGGQDGWVTSWDGAAWVSFGHGEVDVGSPKVNTLALSSDGKLYCIGRFDRFKNAGGTLISNALNLVYYDFVLAAWHGMATGLTTASALMALAIGPDGKVYMGNVANLVVWDGQSLRTLVTVTGGTATIYGGMVVTKQGLVYFSGDFTAANGVTIADRCAVWNGTSVQPLPIDLPGSAIVYSLLSDGDDIYLGFNTEGNATISGISPTATGLVANSGTAPCYPVITVACTVAACTLQEVRNDSTHQTIRFNRAMQIGETITIDCRPGKEDVRSDFPSPNGSQVTMLQPSDLGNFCLLPGNNKVSVYAPGTGATVTVQLRWRIKHDGVEGGGDVMGAVYEVYLYSNTGAYLATLTKRLTRLEWSRIVNDQGSFAITLSDRLVLVDTSLFQLNGRVAIYRKPSADAMSRLEMVGFIRGWDFETDGRGVTRYTWYGPDQNCLLADRACFPWHPYTAGYWETQKHRYIDTLMREIVEDNLGAGSSNEAARDIVTSNGAGLTIAVESSATATLCTTAGQLWGDYAGKNLLAFLQGVHTTSRDYKETGTGTVAVPVFFDMCADADNSFTFRTFATRRGMNHRSDSGQAVHIGTRYGNLVQPRWVHDRTKEVNAGLGLLYAASYSTSSWTLDATRIGEAPLNRREGAGVSAEDTGAIGAQLINDGKPKPKFTGKIQSVPGSLYGLHWGLGDEVTIDYLEKQYNVRVTGISGTFYSGRETLDTAMEVLDT